MKKATLLLPLALLSRACFAFDFLEPQANDNSQLVWIGHLSPDTDTVTAAIIAAHLYGGTAVVPGALNPETKFALDYCQADTPKLLTDVTAKKVALVDFNQQTQLHSAINQQDIVAIVDHHAIGGKPVDLAQVASLDIRAWGSAATILAAHAENLKVTLPPSVACTTLAGILSDTVLLASPTTTAYDRYYTAQLATQAGIADWRDFGDKMLIAKSDLSHLDAQTILTLDYKKFEFAGKKVGIGVAETLTADLLLARKADFIKVMKAYKKAQGLDHLFFSVTDTKNKQANLIWTDAGDGEIINLAFKATEAEQWLNLPGVTSRKRQIGPAIQAAIEQLQ